MSAQNVPSSTLGSIKAIPSKYPMMFGATFTCMKTCGADLFVQTYLEKKDFQDVNWKRTATFATFGFFYMGIAQYVLYVKLMAQKWYPNAKYFAAKSIREKFKDKQGMKDLFSQVAIDQIIHIPFVFYPVYYLTKSTIMDRPVGHEDETITHLAFNKWKTNFRDDVVTSWKIWIPCNIVNFGLMPLEYRVPFMAVCSFGFCIVLSVMRGDKTPELTDEAKKIGQKVFRETKETSVKDLIASIRKVSKKTEMRDGGGLSREEFVLLMQEIGVGDAKIVSSIFNACDKDHDEVISNAELSALLLAFHDIGNASMEERASAIFDCCDLDGGGFLDFEEVAVMCKGLLAMREALLQDGGQMNTMDTMDSIASASGGYQQAERRAMENMSDEERTKQLEKLRKIRLQDLRSRYTRFRNRPETTLEEITQYEASRMAQKMFAEADTIDANNRISRDEFTMWIRAGSHTANGFIKLFSAFEPGLLRE